MLSSGCCESDREISVLARWTGEERREARVRDLLHERHKKCASNARQKSNNHIAWVTMQQWTIDDSIERYGDTAGFRRGRTNHVDADCGWLRGNFCRIKWVFPPLCLAFLLTDTFCSSILSHPAPSTASDLPSTSYTSHFPPAFSSVYSADPSILHQGSSASTRRLLLPPVPPVQHHPC